MTERGAGGVRRDTGATTSHSSMDERAHPGQVRSDQTLRVPCRAGHSVRWRRTSRAMPCSRLRGSCGGQSQAAHTRPVPIPEPGRHGHNPTPPGAITQPLVGHNSARCPPYIQAPLTQLLSIPNPPSTSPLSPHLPSAASRSSYPLTRSTRSTSTSAQGITMPLLFPTSHDSTQTIDEVCASVPKDTSPERPFYL